MSPDPETTRHQRMPRARRRIRSARLRRPGIRLRYAVMATFLAALSFGIAGAIALTLYRGSLVANVDGVVRDAGQAAARAAARGQLPAPIPMPVGVGVPRIQVIDAAGKVVSGDPVSVHAPSMVDLARGLTGHVSMISDPTDLPEERAAVVAFRIKSPTGPLTVVAVGSLDPAYTKASQALDLSAAVGAISLLAIAVVAWATAGRTLRRVDQLRTQVSAITASGDLDRRVPDAGADELADLGSTLNAMLAAMSNSAERQRRFVADAAHELRTPIAGLTASLDVALHHPETVEHTAWIAELAGGHRRLGRLVDDLLVLASLDGDAPARRQPIDLAGIATDSVRRSTPADVTLCAGSIERALVLGDSAQLTRVVTNLVDNALRYASHAVEVGVRLDSNRAVITVTDDGPGVPATERARIWGRFVRLDDGRSRTGGGTGLGLALVKDIVHAHGGTVTVTASTTTGGATFAVVLPLYATDRSPSQPTTTTRSPISSTPVVETAQLRT
jgi:signal transduction histidine kinase